MTSLFESRSCHFSPCRAHRYALRVQWNPGVPPQVFIALNPSTADEHRNDPTVHKCIEFARMWGAGGLIMANAFAFRATDPKVMIAAEDPIGHENTVEYLKAIASESFRLPIAAWGNHGKHLGRGEFLKANLGPMNCLGVNKDGSPVHPLYQSYKRQPAPFNYVPAL